MYIIPIDFTVSNEQTTYLFLLLADSKDILHYGLTSMGS